MSNRTLLGKLGSDFCLRTSKPGYNVVTEGFGSKNISFDSRWIQLATVIQQGVVNVPLGSGTTTVVFPNLGFVPVVLLVDEYGVTINLVAYRIKTTATSISARQNTDHAWTFWYYILNESVT